MKLFSEQPELRKLVNRVELEYLRARREGLGGSLPARHVSSPVLAAPADDVFKEFLEGTGGREVSILIGAGDLAPTPTLAAILCWPHWAAWLACVLDAYRSM